MTVDIDIVPKHNVLGDSLPGDITMPPFTVSRDRGFLPRQDPVVALPPAFEALESILERLPLKTASGEPGILANEGQIHEAVARELPNLLREIEKVKDNLPLLTALYRDYCFLASAYLLEPCHHEFVRSGKKGYGLGKDRLPANISIPLVRVAELTGFLPFMEYAGSYALFNYRRLDITKPLEYDNIALIRAFEHGHDRLSSEAGFILVHVDMVKDSGLLVSGVCDTLEGAQQQDREKFDDALRDVVASLKKINCTMEKMWGKSKPADYVSFRTFIFGTKSQSMFPNGVIYEGVSEKPTFFRGESGANDSMIPLCDNLLQIPMPDTPLTAILKDFRQYRPKAHREFLEYVKETAESAGVREFALKDGISATIYLNCLDEIRDFRWRHWCFTREYILKKTSHPTATGGSPIVMWLPNQLGSVMQQELEIIEKLKNIDHYTVEVRKIEAFVSNQKESLEKEVNKWCQEREV